MGRGENKGIQSLTRFDEEALPIYKDAAGNVLTLSELTCEEYAILNTKTHRPKMRELLETLYGKEGPDRAAVIHALRELARSN